VEQSATRAPPVVSTRADNLCLVAHIPTISRDSYLRSRARLQCVKLDARCVSSTPTLFSLRDRLPSAIGSVTVRALQDQVRPDSPNPFSLEQSSLGPEI
jgi:hypothetical protein